MRSFLSKFAAVLFPIVLFVVAEGTVRSFDHTPFFIPVAGNSDYLTVNPAYAGRYFRGFIPQVAYNPFLRDKPDSVFRVVALGGSSTAGYPYLFNSAFPERFATHYRSVHPTRQIEMVNLGMTALSSHVIRDMIPHVIDMNPDAVLIYAGHNEYYGAFGAGGANRNQILIRVLFWCKKSVLFQKLESIIAPPVESTRTMMEQSTTDIAITKDGSVYHSGIQNFEINLEAILSRLNKEQIQTYVGTLVSNIQSQSPLGSDSVATLHWEKGLDHWNQRDTLAARGAFVLAKEFDPIRFRAPEAMNQVIEEVASTNHATVVNMEPIFGFGSEDSLFTDHLHPTSTGYDLMAQSFLQVVEPKWVTKASSLGAPEPSPFDAAYARLLIVRLQLGFPFTKGLSEENQWQQFDRVLATHQQSGRYADSLASLSVTFHTPVYESLLEAYQRNLAEQDTSLALSHIRSLLYWQPFNESLHFQAAQLASEQSTNLAGEVMQLVASRVPSERYLNTLAAMRIRQGALDSAVQLLELIENDFPDSQVMLYNMARYLVLTGDTLTAQLYYQKYQMVRYSGE